MPSDLSRPSTASAIESVRREVVCRVDKRLLISPTGSIRSFLVHISLNGTDFSIPAEDTIIVHAFMPVSVERNLLAFHPSLKEERIVRVSGSSFLPSANFDYDAVVALTSTDNKLTYGECRACVSCESSRNLSFIMPTFTQFFTSLENGEQLPSYSDATSVPGFLATVRFEFRNDDEELTRETVQFFMYNPFVPITVAPRACRRNGGTELTIQSSYFVVPSKNAQLLITSAGRDTVLAFSTTSVLSQTQR